MEKGREPIFGEAILWHFDGLGVTSLEYSPVHGMYFVVAQPHDGNGLTTLYRWSGMKANPRTPLCTLCLTGVRPGPKILAAFENSDKLLLLAGISEYAGATPPESRFQGIQIRP